jgi:hypothetical protein
MRNADGDTGVLDVRFAVPVCQQLQLVVSWSVLTNHFCRFPLAPSPEVLKSVAPVSKDKPYVPLTLLQQQLQGPRDFHLSQPLIRGWA